MNRESDKWLFRVILFVTGIPIFLFFAPIIFVLYSSLPWLMIPLTVFAGVGIYVKKTKQKEEEKRSGVILIEMPGLKDDDDTNNNKQ